MGRRRGGIMRKVENRGEGRRGAGPLRMVPPAVGVVATCVVAALLFALPAGARRPTHQARTPIYLDTHYTFAERAADLVARLTPTQRASQLVSSQAPAITTAANPLLTDTFGGQTALAAPASAGATNLKVESTGGMAVGAKLTIDPGG